MFRGKCRGLFTHALAFWVAQSALALVSHSAWAGTLPGPSPLSPGEEQQLEIIIGACNDRQLAKAPSCYTKAALQHVAHFDANFDPAKPAPDKPADPIASAYVASIERLHPAFRKSLWDEKEPGGTGKPCSQYDNALDQTICLTSRAEKLLWAFRNPKTNQATVEAALKAIGATSGDIPLIAKELNDATREMDKVRKEAYQAEVFRFTCLDRLTKGTCGLHNFHTVEFSQCVSEKVDATACPAAVPPFHHPSKHKPADYRYLAEPGTTAYKKFEDFLRKQKEEAAAAEKAKAKKAYEAYQKDKSRTSLDDKTDEDEAATNSVLNACFIGDNTKQRDAYFGIGVTGICDAIQNPTSHLASFDGEILKLMAKPDVYHYFELLRMEGIGRLMQAHRDILGEDIPAIPKGCERFSDGINRFKKRSKPAVGMIDTIPTAVAKEKAKRLNQLVANAHELHENWECEMVPQGDKLVRGMCPENRKLITQKNMAVLEDIKLEIGNLISKYPFLGAGHAASSPIESDYPQSSAIASANGTEAIRQAMRQSHNLISNGIEVAITSFCAKKHVDCGSLMGLDSGDPKKGGEVRGDCNDPSIIAKIYDPAESAALKGRIPPVSPDFLFNSGELTGSVLKAFPDYTFFQNCGKKAMDKVAETEKSLKTVMNLACGAATFTPAAVVLGPICALGGAAAAAGGWAKAKEELGFVSHCRKAGGTVCSDQAERNAYDKCQSYAEEFASQYVGAGAELIGAATQLSSAVRAARLEGKQWVNLEKDLKALEAELKGIKDPKLARQRIAEFGEAHPELKMQLSAQPEAGGAIYVNQSMKARIEASPASFNQEAEKALKSKGVQFEEVPGGKTYVLDVDSSQLGFNPGESFKQVKVYKVKSVKAPKTVAGPKERLTGSPFDHPEFNQKVAELEKLGVQVRYDPALNIKGTHGYFDPGPPKVIMLGPDSDYLTLVHEMDHALWDAHGLNMRTWLTATYARKDGVPFEMLFTEEQRKHLRPELLQEHLSKGTSFTAVSEASAVKAETDALLGAGYAKVDLAYANKRLYALEHEIESYKDAMKKGPLAPWQAKGLEEAEAEHASLALIYREKSATPVVASTKPGMSTGTKVGIGAGATGGAAASGVGVWYYNEKTHKYVVKTEKGDWVTKTSDDIMKDPTIPADWKAHYKERQ